MIIDCAGCVMRDLACGDCVVSFLLGPPPEQIGSQEQVALAALADGGLVPPLRMRPVPGPPDEAHAGDAPAPARRARSGPRGAASA